MLKLRILFYVCIVTLTLYWWVYEHGIVWSPQHVIIHGPVEATRHHGHTCYYDALLVHNDNHRCLKCMEFPTCNKKRNSSCFRISEIIMHVRILFKMDGLSWSQMRIPPIHLLYQACPAQASARVCHFIFTQKEASETQMSCLFLTFK